MPRKSPEQKSYEKMMKQQKELAEKEQRRDRAAQIVGSAKHIGDFRVMDSDSETILELALKAYSGNDENRTVIQDSDLPKYLKYSVLQECENLVEYGMISGYFDIGSATVATLSTQGKSYFKDKEEAQQKAIEMAKTKKWR